MRKSAWESQRVFRLGVPRGAASISPHSLGSFSPVVFPFNLNWHYWNFVLLQVFSWTKLEVLNVPIRIPSGCDSLKMGLAQMARFRSLTITDLPLSSILDPLFLGQGIMSRHETLRYLGMAMGYPNRHHTWDNEEAFGTPP